MKIFVFIVQVTLFRVKKQAEQARLPPLTHCLNNAANAYIVYFLIGRKTPSSKNCLAADGFKAKNRVQT